MNIHLMPDDKFIDNFINMAESIAGPNRNRYILWYPGTESRSLKYVTKLNITHAPLRSKTFSDIIQNLNSDDNVVIHWLDPAICALIPRINKNVPLTWSVWGGDFYSPLRYFENDLLDSASIDYLHQENRLKIGLNPKWPLLQLKYNALTWLQDCRNYRLKAQAIARINRICNFDDTIFHLIRQRFITSAGFFWFCYGGLPDSLLQIPSHLENPKPTAERTIRILLGNSATLENNHFSVLQSLSKHPLNKSMQIICPLSYGHAHYGNDVEKEGKLLFQDRFTALREYIDEAAYFKILKNCDFAIMNHKRTQAAGNIAAMLAMGKRVFMNSQSSLFKYFLRNKVQVFPIESILSESAPLLLTNFLLEEQNSHRIKLQQLFWGKTTEDGYREMMLL